MVRDIPLHSACCEHHLVPFAGRAHVAYIPGDDGRITGLSKIARLVDGFAKRPQVQERLTTQIADALVDVLEPDGRAGDDRGRAPLHVDARASRSRARSPITSAVRGLFKSNAATRAEAMSLITLPRKPPVSLETCRTCADATGHAGTRAPVSCPQCSPGRRSAGSAPP